MMRTIVSGTSHSLHNQHQPFDCTIKWLACEAREATQSYGIILWFTVKRETPHGRIDSTRFLNRQQTDHFVCVCVWCWSVCMCVHLLECVSVCTCTVGCHPQAHNGDHTCLAKGTSSAAPTTAPTLEPSAGVLQRLKWSWWV